jgi:hypothetical protein
MAINSLVVASSASSVNAAIAAKYNLRLCGFSVSEDAGSTAAVTIMHAALAATNNPAVAPINLAANGFGMWGISNQGIPCPNGISIARGSGTTTVVIYYDTP